MAWHPTLDDIERRLDGPYGHGPAPRRDNREPSTRRMAIGGPGCWCGNSFPCDWPGKDAGQPHPRDARPRDMPMAPGCAPDAIRNTPQAI